MSTVFAQPWLLLGAAAIVLPILIHLWLRPRPRRVRFPALRFVAHRLAVGRNAQRWRHWLLLALRCGLLALAALLLAEPTCRADRARPVVSDPTALVLVIDDSWSTRIRLPDGRTAGEASLQDAHAVLSTAADWPPNSSVGLVWTDPSRRPEPPTADVQACRSRLSGSESASLHAAALGPALQQAAAYLDGRPQPRKRIVVFTDGAAHAWHDVALSTLARTAVELEVVTPPDLPRGNSGIIAVAQRDRTRLADAPLDLAVALRTGSGGAPLTLQAALGPRAFGGITVPGGTSEAEVSLELLPVGLHAVTLTLEPADRLEFDQVHHLALETVPRPRAWLLAGAPLEFERDMTLTLIANLLAPDGLAESRQRVELHRLTADQLADRALAPDAAADAGLIVLPIDVALSPAVEELLERAVERGTTLLMLPRAATTPRAPPWRRLCSDDARVEPVAPAQTIEWDADSPLSRMGRGIDELRRAAAHVRLNPGITAQTGEAAARWTDGTPALLERRLGRGAVTLLCTSPDPQWSDLGRRAAGLLTLLHAITAPETDSPHTANFIAGRRADRRFAGFESDLAARVSRRESPELVENVTLRDGAPVEGWPTRTPGIYEVRGRSTEALYAVNWPDAEGDLTPLDEAELRRRTGVESATIRTGGAPARADASRRFWLPHPTQILALSLLLLLILEAWMSGPAEEPAAGGKSSAANA